MLCVIQASAFYELHSMHNQKFQNPFFDIFRPAVATATTCTNLYHFHELQELTHIEGINKHALILMNESKSWQPFLTLQPCGNMVKTTFLDLTLMNPVSHFSGITKNSYNPKSHKTGT
jgi:hypothetical protein